MAHVEFEVGLVYTKNGKYYLAVGTRKLIFSKRGEFIEIRPHSEYHPVRSMKFEGLRKAWKVSADNIDQIFKLYAYPSDLREKSKIRKRGDRNNTFSRLVYRSTYRRTG